MHKIKKKSLILEITILTVILILVPSGLIMLFFTRTVSKTMMKQAEKNADYYIYQTELSMTNTISSARNLAFSTLSNGTIRQYMISGKEDTMTYGRSAFAGIAASISLFDDNSKNNAVNAVYLFRDNTN